MPRKSLGAKHQSKISEILSYNPLKHIMDYTIRIVSISLDKSNRMINIDIIVE